MRYSLLLSGINMSTKDEIEYLQRTLKIFTDFKLVNFRWNKNRSTFETVERKMIYPLSLLIAALHFTNISLSFWIMRKSTTQVKVLNFFQILVSLAATSYRCTVVQYDSEIISLVNNIFKLNSFIGLYMNNVWRTKQKR